MTKAPLIGVYVDEYATSFTNKDYELREIKHYLKQIVPDATVIEVEPRNLEKHSNLDCYLFDFGGFCYIDYSGTLRTQISRDVLKYVEMYPNTLFVPMSRSTSTYVKDIALDEMKSKSKNINYECARSMTDAMSIIYEWLFFERFEGDLEFFAERLPMGDEPEDD